MCFTGGFALGDDGGHSRASHRCSASRALPSRSGPPRARDLNLSPGDLDIVKGRCAAGQQVLGLRYRKDPAVGRRFETLTTELGDAFVRVEFEGRGHSTVTTHRQQAGVDAVLGFLAENLRA